MKNNKNVLLTGASGFLGSSILKKLITNQFNVLVISRSNSDGFRLHGIINDFTKLISDTFYSKDLVQKINEVFPAYTMINSSWKGVDSGARNSIWQIKDNFDINFSLLNLAKDTSCQHFITLGSSAEYGALNKKIFEDDHEKPSTIYGKAKLLVNIASEAFLNDANIKYTNLRVFNIYGPYDNENRFISYVIKSLLEHKSPNVTSCRQRLDYLYSEDFSEAVLQVVKHKPEGIFNLGSGGTIELKQLIDIICSKINNNTKPNIGAVSFREDRVMHSQANIEKLKSVIKWEPTVSIDEGITLTIDYFRSIS